LEGEHSMASTRLVHRCLRTFAALLVASLWLYVPALSLGAAAIWEEGRSVPLAQQPQPPAFVELAKALKPAVVNISTAQEVKRSPRTRSPFGEEGDPFQDFFERFFGQRAPRRRRPSLGSGFIIHSTGYIVTNNHVIEGATEIKVTLATQEEFDAKLIGRDPKTDLALIKVDSKIALPTVPFGSSESIEVGDWVLAIGNPFGLGHTVTAGIVSAKGRIIGAGPYDDFIQTDASINPGNSGGPLFNMRGEVIGINTAIVASGQGIGFAIPSNMAKEILLQLHGSGKVTRGWLGVAIQRLSSDLVQAFGLPDAHGALVADVMPNGPAAKAGIERGDIIVAFRGEKVQESSDLPRMVAAVAPGTKVDIDLLRGGKKLTIPVNLGAMKDDEPETVARLQPSDVEEALGMQVQSITPDVARALRLENTDGVVVSRVDPDGPAAEAGIQRGDVIREINRKPVTDTETYQDATAQLTPDTPVLFLLERRGGGGRYVALKPRKTG
jgi:serine protease Do